ncbi:MAG TPA: hypothetical protein VFD41_08245 [Actinomycetales bacterium]|nr:hypothetical protein [Actinomycetales bacterium]
MSRRFTGALVAASVAGGCWAARHRVPGGAERWERTNHRGETVSLLEGPAWAAGAVAGVAALGVPVRVRAGLAVATAGAALFGAVDDLVESGTHKGLRGHLGELAAGRLTTGGLKVLGIGVTSLAAAALLLRPTSPRDQGLHARPVRMESLIITGWEVGVAGALVAGAANLANLLDLRPGRVLKLAIASAAVAPASPAVAAAVGSSVSLLGPDLGERSMLGDCGANAAGALLGAALVARTADDGSRGRRLRAAVLTGVVALTVASERVSFTRVIESAPVLRELDALGRRPSQAS